MARPVYSKLLFQTNSVSGITALAGPPPGKIWVMRYVGVTIGAYIGYIHAGVGVGDEGPWQFITDTTNLQIVGVAKRTIWWEGRIVVPEGFIIYANVLAPDTADYMISGYELTAD